MTLKNHTLKANQVIHANPLEAAQNLLKSMTDNDLLVLRHDLDKLLKIDLAQLDLADELGLQYRSGMTLLSSVQDDNDTPVNQRAQVFNSVNSMLSNIVKTQEIIYSIERLKKYEVAFLKAAETLTTEAKEAFFDLYGEYLNA